MKVKYFHYPQSFTSVTEVEFNFQCYKTFYDVRINIFKEHIPVMTKLL